MGLRAAVVVLVLTMLTVLAGCDPAEEPSTGPAADPTPTSVSSMFPPEPAETVRVQPFDVTVDLRSPAQSEPILDEGFVRFFSLRDGEHRDVAGSVRDGFRDLPPGTYRIRAGVNPCDGNCSVLDGVTNRCRRVVSLSTAATVEVRLHTARACEISVRRG